MPAHVYLEPADRVALCGVKRLHADGGEILARFVAEHRANYPLELCEGCELELAHPSRLFA